MTIKKHCILIIFSLLILSTFTVNDNFMSPLVAQAATTTTVSKVASVKKSTVTAMSATVKWSRVTGAEGYKIYCSSKYTGDYKLIKTIKSGKTLSNTFTNLEPNTIYYYKIKAYKGKVNSAYSKVLKVTTPKNIYRVSKPNVSLADSDGIMIYPSSMYFEEGHLICEVTFVNTTAEDKEITYDKQTGFYLRVNYTKNNKTIAKKNITGLDSVVINAGKDFKKTFVFYNTKETNIANVDISCIGSNYDVRTPNKNPIAPFTNATQDKVENIYDSMKVEKPEQYSLITYDINSKTFNLPYDSVYVKDKQQIGDILKFVWNTDYSDKNYIMIMTKRGFLDDLCNEYEKLNKEVMSVGPNSKLSADAYYNRDSYLYRLTGLDYQEYFMKGSTSTGIHKLAENDSISYYYIIVSTWLTAEKQELIEEKIADILPNINQGSTYDKIKSAHDYLVDHIEYKETTSEESHTAYGAMITGNSVCEGYAEAFQQLMKAMNIPCYIVTNVNHAWNVVYMEGKWYHVDVTNDDVNNTEIYFLLGKDIMNSTTTRYMKLPQTQENYESYAIFNTDDINYYGYIDGSNTCSVELTDISYNKAISSSY